MQQWLEKFRAVILCTGVLLVLSFFGCVMVAFRHRYLEAQNCLYLVWNLFLAWIPLGVSLVIHYIGIRPRGKGNLLLLVPLGIVWLLFYPNAPYVITDFIHFQVRNTMMTWYDLVMYSVFTLTSLLIGFLSMYLVGDIVKRWTKPVWGWFFTITILFLSSYGVYLGRFIRWNSWDLALNPFALLSSVLENINFKSIMFSLLFSTLLSLIYAFLYGLTRLKSGKADLESGSGKIETDEG